MFAFQSHSSGDQIKTAFVQDSIHGRHSGRSEDWSKSLDTQEVDDEMPTKRTEYKIALDKVEQLAQMNEFWIMFDEST